MIFFRIFCLLNFHLTSVQLREREREREKEREEEGGRCGETEESRAERQKGEGMRNQEEGEG